MATLAGVRAELVDALKAAALPARGDVPERITPPAVFVLPRNPYLVPDGMCGYRVRSRVLIVGPKATNAAAGDQLDTMITDALGVLEDTEHEIESVQEPVSIELNGVAGVFLGSVILLETPTEITE